MIPTNLKIVKKF